MNDITLQLYNEITKKARDLNPLYYPQLENFHRELWSVYRFDAPAQVKERFIRRLHDIISETLEELNFELLQSIATLGNPKRIWQMPATGNDTPKNRRRIHAHAMNNLMHNYARSTYCQWVC